MRKFLALAAVTMMTATGALSRVFALDEALAVA